jgi:hypothetical protein
VGYENGPNENGERLVWLAPADSDKEGPASMFSLLARIWTRRIGAAVDDYNVTDRAGYSEPSLDSPNESFWPLLLHIRQDIKLIAVLLTALIVALGVLADLVGLAIIVEFFGLRWS